MIRSSMLEVLNQGYIRVARAKGVPRRRILWRHALRNALPPIATISGLQLGYLLGGALAGSLLLVIIIKLIFFLGMPAFAQYVAEGVIIIGAMAAHLLRRREA